MSIRIRSAAALTAVTALLVTSCGDAGTGPAGGTDDDAQEGGTLRYAQTSLPPDGADPHVEPSLAAQQIARPVVDSLVYEDEDGQFHPWLAEDWEISEDGTEYTFYLRDDVTFSDGTEFNAEAVVANFDRIIDPETESLFANTLIQPYESSEAVDEHTVVVRLSEPSAPFLQAVSGVNLGIQSPAAFESAGEGYGYEIVGSGPFTIESYSPDTEIRLARREDYDWAPEPSEQQGPANLEEVVISALGESSTRTGALQSGSVDAIGEVPALDAERLEAEGYQIVNTQAGGVPYTIWFNVEREPFGDQRVREAFRASVDVDSIVTTLYGDVIERGWSVLTPNTTYYNADLERSWDYDPEHAAALLDEAGWDETDEEGYRINEEGERLTVVAIQEQTNREQRDQYLLAVQDSAAAAGFDVEVEFLESGSISDRDVSGDYDIRASSFSRTDPDILKMNVWSENLPPSGQNRSRVQSDQIDDLLLRGAAEQDEAEREAIYYELQDFINEEVYGFPGFLPAYTLAHADHVHGFTTGPTQWPTFYTAWIED
ncbi:ABC transporter substrate-binding protein [Nesterenkonia alkaliphila]|uniref:ABC transporter substrate-binding protein n=1 Tax=Nesterenkonia alkaliphila TaxID=1463631 RepID=A0A7K1UL61_9MICC|nr:ABC transporter substrate-binding protein [Nesterenkonia alkaliphila]MVT27228.1 ABC transporter substrate-binding protein [Nesterenkonia alkaliphila]GFZ78441.1 peptide ABC transporter [Nesterenkonia alkaliphila]